MLGYNAHVILAGRRINDGMGKYIAEQTVKTMVQSGRAVKNADVNVLGLTFKGIVPDLRKSKVIDVIRELRSHGVLVHVHDPVATAKDPWNEYGVELCAWEELPVANAIVAAVAHADLVGRPPEKLCSKLLAGGEFVDVKCTADAQALRSNGYVVWRP